MSSKSKEFKTEAGGKQAGFPQWIKIAHEWWYRKFGRIVGPLVFVIIFFIFVSISVVTLDVTDKIFSSNTFCAYTCHVMERTVYKELQESKHWTTSTGVRPTCADCHIRESLTLAMIDHFIGTGEFFVWISNDFSETGSFEEFRPAAADRTRFKMLENDSINCRRCHVMEGIKPERIRGQNQHEEAMNNGTTCIVCHYNLVHKEVEPSVAFQNIIEAIIANVEEPIDEQLNAELKAGAETDEEEEVL